MLCAKRRTPHDIGKSFLESSVAIRLCFFMNGMPCNTTDARAF